MARILLVEDDSALAECLTAGLRLAGHEVLAVGTFSEAIEGIEEFKPHWIITDGYFQSNRASHGFGPWGLDVMRVCCDAGIPAVLLTGDDHIFNRGKERGFVVRMKGNCLTSDLIATLEAQRVKA